MKFDPRTLTGYGGHPSFSMGDTVVFNDAVGPDSINIVKSIYGHGPFKIVAVVNHTPEVAAHLGIHQQQVFIAVEHRNGRPSCQLSSLWFMPAPEGCGNG